LETVNLFGARVKPSLVGWLSCGEGCGWSTPLARCPISIFRAVKGWKAFWGGCMYRKSS